MIHSLLRRIGNFLLIAGLLAGVSRAQVSYTGGTYTENFATATDSALPAGWLFAESGTNANTALVIGTGTANAGNTYLFGTGGEYALGGLQSGSLIPTIGFAFTNNTGAALTSVTVAYTGETWRVGTASRSDRLDFQYSTDATSLITGTWTDVNALDYANPGGAAIAGGSLQHSASISSSIPLSVPNGATVYFRWSDFNASGSDDGMGVDDFSISTGGGPVTPTVVSTSPANGAVGVPVAAPITVTFNQAVNVTGTWFTLSGATTGAVGATVSGGPTAYTLTPAASFTNNETVTLTILAAQVTDQATGTVSPAANYTATFTTVAAPGTPIKIHAIQGSGTASAYVGLPAPTISGVVTGFFTGSAGTREGFYVQEEDADADADPATSEALYVYTAPTPALASTVNSLALGDVVTVVAKVVEYFDLTEMTTEAVAEATVQKTGTAALPAAVAVALPAATSTSLERYENMRVRFEQKLTVTGNNSLGQYGELVLSGSGLIYQPTNIVDPNDAVASGTNSTTTGGNTNVAAVTAQQTANNLAVIILDDATSRSYPDPTPHLNAQGTRRVGDTVTGIEGILTYRFSFYRLDPQGPVAFADDNPRPLTAPDVGTGATLKVASANVLNYFLTLGSAGRGATNSTEFTRQRAKTVASLSTMNADIIGLMEIERDSTAPTNGPLADLVAGLNDALGAGTYAYVDSTAIAGTDAIQVALVYKPAMVTPVGVARTDSANLSVYNRPPLVQTFSVNATGAKFTVVVNHFKSKGGSGSGADADVGDGQANFNGTRKAQANALAAYLATPAATFGDPDVLIVGDLNAYAEEDPIDILRAAGYTDLLQVYTPGGYSYQFDSQLGYLDHALANTSLLAQITGAEHWHINGDEPSFYDYNTENKTANHQAINLNNPFRSADHDPVLIGFDLAGPPVITQEPVSVTVGEGGTATFSVAASGREPFTFQWRKGTLALGAAVPSASTATLTLENVQPAQAGDYNVVVTTPYGTVTSQNATLTVLTGFAGWQANNFSPGELASPSVSGPNAIYGDDGLTNLVKYALGLNPKQNITTGLPETGTTATDWTYTYTRPVDRADVVFTVERSSDLVNWTTVNVTHAEVSSSGGMATWRATYPFASAADRNFFRLQVTRP